MALILRMPDGAGISPAALREALLALPEGTSHGGGPPDPALVYLPPAHVKALNPDVQLVTGMRGAGKTFWWSALQDGAVRRVVGGAVKRPPLNENTEVRTGFGPAPAPDEYPGPDDLRRLMAEFEPRTVWRTVLAWQFTRGEDHPLRKCGSWPARTRYVAENPDAVDRAFQERDAEFDWKGVHLMVLFDALDRCADDWKDMYRAIRGLLQAALDLRSCKRLRMKVFLRPDQADAAQISDFPDASKVLYSAVNLNWPRRELYGLLWHCLGNGPKGDTLRAFLGGGLGNGPQAGTVPAFLGGGDWPSASADGPRAFSVPRALVLDDDLQRETFHRIAGPSMGANRRRGRPYTWVANHLEDTEKRVSPRSFLAALRTAAEDTANEHPDHDYALHHDSIKRGVQAASTIRVLELQEDHPWVHRAMSALAGMVVPLDFDEIADRWQSRGVLDELLPGQGEGEGPAPRLRILVVVEGLDDLPAGGVVVPGMNDAAGLPPLEVHEDVHQAHVGRPGARPVDAAVAAAARVLQEAGLLKHLRHVDHRVLLRGAAVVGDHEEGGVVAGEAAQAADPAVDGGVGALHPLAAAPLHRRGAPEWGSAARRSGWCSRRRGSPSSAGPSPGSRRGTRPPPPGARGGTPAARSRCRRRSGRGRRGPGSAGVAHVAVDLGGHGGGLGVAVGGPDLGDEELERSARADRVMSLARTYPPHLAAVDLEAVQPPVAPLADAEVGQRPAGVLGAAYPHPVVAAAAAGVDQGVQLHRAALPPPVHALASPGPTAGW